MVSLIRIPIGQWVAELGPDVPFACSLVKFIDGTISEMNNPIPTWDWGRLKAKGLDIVLVSRCSFVSVLIPRWVMEAFGLPYKEILSLIFTVIGHDALLMDKVWHFHGK